MCRRYINDEAPYVGLQEKIRFPAGERRLEFPMRNPMRVRFPPPGTCRIAVHVDDTGTTLTYVDPVGFASRSHL